MSARLTANGFEIDRREESFGRLRDSTRDLACTEILRSRLERDGYLFLRDVIDRSLLDGIREAFVDELRKRDVLDTHDDLTSSLRARDNVDLYDVISELNEHDSVREICDFHDLRDLISRLFGSSVRVLDYVWPRVAGPGRGSPPHCDRVYMSRGAQNLLSVWIPVVDVPIEQGALMILEDSHGDNAHTRDYLAMDADRLGVFNGLRMKHGRLVHGGRYSVRPDRVREEFATRWLTEDFRRGDIVIFGMTCLHATLDNHTSNYRLSVDMRFQPSDEPVDPRFEGSDPAVHAGRDKSIVDFLQGLKRLFRRLL